MAYYEPIARREWPTYEFSLDGYNKAMADHEHWRTCYLRSRSPRTAAMYDLKATQCLTLAKKIERFLKWRDLMPVTEEERFLIELDRIAGPAKGQTVVDYQGKRYRRYWIPLIRDPRDGEILFFERKWVELTGER